MKFALGTVQFGMNYGVSNRNGKPSSKEIKDILSVALSNGISLLDTASMYGTTEEILGRQASGDFRIVSKLRSLKHSKAYDIGELVNEECAQSLENTRRDLFYGYLIHDVDDLSLHGDSLWDAMLGLRKDGLVNGVGYSVYSPSQLSDFFPRYKADLIQLPMNVLDREFVKSGWLQRLKDQGVEVHVRSAFLQGLLLMDLDEQMARFPLFSDFWLDWHAFLSSSGLTALQACLGYLNAFPEIDRIVVGVNNCSELVEILSCNDLQVQVPGQISSSNPFLIYPFNWIN